MSWLRSSATLIAVLASENRIVDVILPPEFEVRKPLLLRTPFGSVRSSNSLAACLAAVALSEFAKSISFCRLKCLIASSSNGSNGTGASSLASAFAMRSFHGCTAPLWLAHALAAPALPGESVHGGGVRHPRLTVSKQYLLIPFLCDARVAPFGS